MRDATLPLDPSSDAMSANSSLMRISSISAAPCHRSSGGEIETTDAASMRASESHGSESSGSQSLQPTPMPMPTHVVADNEASAADADHEISSTDPTDGPDADRASLVVAPGLEEVVFESWEAFYAYLAVYQARSYQVRATDCCSVLTPSSANEVLNLLTIALSTASTMGTTQHFRLRSTTSVDERNRRIETSASRARVIPAEWGVYAKTLVCTHAGKYRYRGTGKRQWHETRPMDCKAKVRRGVIGIS